MLVTLRAPRNYCKLILIFITVDCEGIPSRHGGEEQGPHFQHNLHSRQLCYSQLDWLLCNKIWCHRFQSIINLGAEWNGKNWHLRDLCSTLYSKHWTSVVSKASVSQSSGLRHSLVFQRLENFLAQMLLEKFIWLEPFLYQSALVIICLFVL